MDISELTVLFYFFHLLSPTPSTASGPRDVVRYQFCSPFCGALTTQFIVGVYLPIVGIDDYVRHAQGNHRVVIVD